MPSSASGPAARLFALVRRGRYRAYQFVHGLRPHLSAVEVVEVRRHLRPPELRLFLEIEPRDRRHSVDLYRLLQREGASAVVLRAALLHDAGKGRLATWQRVAFVVLQAASPGLLDRLAADGRGWRGALWRLRHHAALGATVLEAAGCEARLVAIVRSHTDPPPPDDPELARFIAADDRV